jgi:hypothetical protein
MKSRLLLLALAATWLLLLACGGSQQMTTGQTANENSNKVSGDSPCPDWFLKVPEAPDYLFAAATSTSRDLQTAINKAKQDARVDIGSQVETRLQALTKQFKEEIGEGVDARIDAQFTTVSKSVVSTTLRGCKVKNQSTKQEGPIWRACVLMEYPIGAANAKFLQSLKDSEVLRQKAAATDAFKELETEVQKYEQEKEKKMQNNQL